MLRRELSLPVAIGIIVVVLLLVVAFFWRKASPPTEAVLQKWAPHPQQQMQRR
jgi:uncharacterized protein YpmB